MSETIPETVPEIVSETSLLQETTLIQEPLKCAQCDTLGEMTFAEYEKSQLGVPSKICIKNLPEGITESGIKNLFLTIGKPLYISYSSWKATCYVEFSTWKEAELAVRDLNNTPPYFLKVFKTSSKIRNESKADSGKHSCKEKENCEPVKPHVNFGDKPKEESEIQQSLEDNITEEELASKVQEDLQMQSVLKSLSYDPSVRMRQRKLDFKSKWDCVSLGRGYFYTDSTDRYFGGTQTYSIINGKPKIEVNYNCENCNALTTRICKNCNGSYCSIACLNNDVLDHKNSCKEARLKLESESSESDIVKKEKTSENSSPEENILDSKSYNLESGSLVVISTYITLQTVFVRRIEKPWEEKFVKLCNDVAASAMKEENLKPGFQVGDLCNARYYEDLCFYRAKICDIENDEIKVQFLDFGNTQVTKLEDLKCLPEDLKKTPALAVKVTLKNVPKGSSLEAVNYFNKLTAERISLVISCVGCYSSSKNWNVLPWKIVGSFAAASSVGEHRMIVRINHEHIIRCLLTEDATSYETFGIFFNKEFEDISQGVILREEESRDSVNEKVTNYSLPSWKKDKNVFSKLGEVYYMDTIKTPVLEVGKKYSLRISHFCEKEFLESGVFWMTLVDSDDFYHVKGEMKERIMEYCEELKNDYYLPRVNELCLAKEKGEWHRCVNLKNQKTACFLFFVDDGHSSIIETNNIRRIIKDFIEAPAQGICCMLSDDEKLKENKEIQLKICNSLKCGLNQTIKSVQIIEFLGDVYRVSLPEVAELMP